MTRRVAWCALLLSTVASGAAGAQTGAQLGETAARPRLEAAADTNDWLAYYSHGVQRIQREPARAAEAFYWAGRLNPAAAEPWYARGVALWRAKPGLFMAYMQEHRGARASPVAIAIDSLIRAAILRDPLVNQQLAPWMFEGLPGEWSRSLETQGLLAYAGGKYEQAMRRFSQALADRRPRLGARYYRALVFVAMGRDDSAAVELTRLVDEMRRQDLKQLVSAYESKAVYEYALGSVYRRMKRPGEAREALGRALVEDLSLYSAHAALGDLAREQGDTAQALREYEQAVELGGHDALVRFGYGAALVGAGRHEDARREYRKVIELEPHWALPHFNLGVVAERLGDSAAAREAFDLYLRRAPRVGEERFVAAAQRKLAPLR